MIEWIKSLFNKAVKVFKSLIDEAFPIAVQIVIAALKDIAVEAVTAMAETDLSNEEKRSGAFTMIKDYAFNSGIEAKDSLISALTEIAYLKYKEEF